MPQRPPSRRRLQDARRLYREQQAAAKAKRRRQQNWLVIGGSVLAGVVVLGLVGLSIHNRGGAPSLEKMSVSPPALTVTETSTAAATVDTAQTSPIKDVTFYTGMTNTAVETKVTYNPVPPVGGSYNAVWLNCGAYNDPVPDEYAVHSLERGAVWITYREGLDPKSVDTLIKLTTKLGGSLVLSPYSNLTNPVVASAWGVQLKVDDVNDPRLTDFVNTYRNSASAPEPNSSCTGGIGQPRGTVRSLPSAPDATPSAGATDLASPTPTEPAALTTP